MTKTMNNSIFNSLPWWMNPKYPMGRADYFWATWGVGILAFLGYLATCACIGAAYGFRAGMNGTEFNEEMIPSRLISAALIPWLLTLVPLQYRRCKAAALPYNLIWISFGMSCVELLAWPDSPVTPLTVFTLIIEFWIWLAPNKMDVIRTNPNPENLFPELK